MMRDEIVEYVVSALREIAADIIEIAEQAIRADEGERIARAIENLERVTTHGVDPGGPPYTVWQDEAAQAARGGGSALRAGSAQ